MKTRFFLFAALLCITFFTLSSFRDSDDLMPNQVPEAVKSTFGRMYTGKNVRWEKDNHQYKAEFRKDRSETEAWFKKDGTWTRTETDVNPRDLPAEVKDYVKSKYPNGIIDDADMVETAKKGSYYDLEIRKGHSEVNIKVTPEGRKF